MSKMPGHYTKMDELAFRRFQEKTKDYVPSEKLLLAEHDRRLQEDLPDNSKDKLRRDFDRIWSPCQ
jgi:hypothetical protein